MLVLLIFQYIGFFFLCCGLACCGCMACMAVATAQGTAQAASQFDAIAQQAEAEQTAAAAANAPNEATPLNQSVAEGEAPENQD